MPNNTRLVQPLSTLPLYFCVLPTFDQRSLLEDLFKKTGSILVIGERLFFLVFSVDFFQKKKFESRLGEN
jgi:hypothetical protein